MAHLYRYEAKGLQHFILQTNQLKEIKGGSLLIEELKELLEATCEAIPEERRPTILNIAAGGANLQFEDEETAKEFQAVWPMVVSQFAPGLQVVQAALPFEERADGSLWEELQKKLRGRRNYPLISLPEAGPAVFRSARTGLPAAVTNRLPDGPQRQDKGLYRRSQRGQNQGKDRVGEKIDPQQRWALDLSRDIGARPVATVHIDGNDLGHTIQKLTQKGGDIGGELGAFSRRLSSLTLDAARAGYKAAFDQWGGEKEDVFPGRPVVLGGDDLTFLLRADLALAFVKGYLRSFEARAQESGSPLTACAGVAITSISFPFSQAHLLAEQLCSFAKSHLRQRGAHNTTASGVAFHRVTTSMISDYQEILDTELCSSGDSGFLTAGPYPLSPIDGFLPLETLEQLASGLQGLPASGVRETIGLLAIDRPKAQERWQRLEEVMGDTPQRQKKWQQIEQLMEPEDDLLELSLRGAQPCSPLLDAWTLLCMDETRD